MKPLIGLTPTYTGKYESYFPVTQYYKAIIALGGVPLLIPILSEREQIKPLVEALDGIVFSGGHDIQPSYYNEEETKELGLVVPERDRLEYLLFDEIMKTDLPLLGICRGMQIINVFLGGSLYQDIPTSFPSDIKHSQEKPFHNACHSVTITDEKFKNLLGEKINVNSRHHQGIKKLADSLSPFAQSDDGLIEGVYMKNRDLLAVQWHPEYLFNKDPGSEKIIKYFIDLCKK